MHTLINQFIEHYLNLYRHFWMSSYSSIPMKVKPICWCAIVWFWNVIFRLDFKPVFKYIWTMKKSVDGEFKAFQNENLRKRSRILLTCWKRHLSVLFSICVCGESIEMEGIIEKQQNHRSWSADFLDAGLIWSLRTLCVAVGRIFIYVPETNKNSSVLK